MEKGHIMNSYLWGGFKQECCRYNLGWILTLWRLTGDRVNSKMYTHYPRLIFHPANGPGEFHVKIIYFSRSVGKSPFRSAIQSVNTSRHTTEGWFNGVSMGFILTLSANVTERLANQYLLVNEIRGNIEAVATIRIYNGKRKWAPTLTSGGNSLRIPKGKCVSYDTKSNRQEKAFLSTEINKRYWRFPHVRSILFLSKGGGYAWKTPL